MTRSPDAGMSWVRACLLETDQANTLCPVKGYARNGVSRGAFSKSSARNERTYELSPFQTLPVKIKRCTPKTGYARNGVTWCRHMLEASRSPGKKATWRSLASSHRVGAGFVVCPPSSDCSSADTPPYFGVGPGRTSERRHRYSAVQSYELAKYSP